jgi:hypothetical protein
MENQIGIAPDIRLLLHSSPCAGASCEAAAAIDFAGQSLCAEHFLPACIAEIEARNERLRNLPFDPVATEALKTFIADCAKQVQKLAESLDEVPVAKLDERLVEYPRYTQAYLKPVLLDFLLRMSQLSRSIRRGPRTTSSVAVWLRREDPHQTWHEETWTVSVSRHGAALLCRRPVEKGGTVVLCRKDKGSRAEAQVVYSLRDSEGRKQIGVQFRDPVNFWDMD